MNDARRHDSAESVDEQSEKTPADGALAFHAQPFRTMLGMSWAASVAAEAATGVS